MILVLNSGSLSEKFALFDLPQLHCIDSAAADVKNVEERYQCLADFCKRHEQAQITMVGHRFVHGGSLYQNPTIVDSSVMQSLDKLQSLAPLHNPPAIQGLTASQQLFPQATQVLVFDTAFHKTLDQAHYTYPIAKELGEFRRWGFHGISYQWSLERTAELLGKKPSKLSLLVCHLGGGASICAIKDGVSVDTTMGFTPMEGLMMGTRSGSIDPGIILSAVKTLDEGRIDQALNKASGLLGVSGLSADMRTIEEAMSQGHAQAQLAHEMYVLSVRKNLFAMAANLETLDAVVFTGGIGYFGWQVRKGVCSHNLLGLELDLAANRQSGDRLISAGDSRAKILCIEAKEEVMIARACMQVQTGTMSLTN